MHRISYSLSLYYVRNQGTSRDTLAELLPFNLDHMLELPKQDFIKEFLSLKRSVRDVCREHNNILFVFALELKVKLIVFLSRLVLSRQVTPCESYIVSTESPSLSTCFLIPILLRANIAVSDLHSTLVQLTHIFGLHRKLLTRFTILKL